MSEKSAADGFRALSHAAVDAGRAYHRFVHAFLHHGEGQDPRRCEWCRHT